MIKEKNKNPLAEVAWNLWCIVSMIGIWPRFIEPNLLKTTTLTLRIPHLPSALHGLKILQFSDLHLSQNASDRFLNKLRRRIARSCPDLILFTGDFICYSLLDDPERLLKVLKSCQARYGCYAVLGNHDYQEYVSINDDGAYDVIEQISTLKKGWGRLFSKVIITKEITAKAKTVSLQQDLLALLKETPFQLLHNEHSLIPIQDTFLNVCGLGEHMLGRCQPDIAFKKYDPRYPGIILIHNPDGIPYLKGYPGDLILSGHTHGGQVNLPGLYQKFMTMENMHLKRGLLKIDGKWVYINRGIGSVMPFRWFSAPELLLLTLR